MTHEPTAPGVELAPEEGNDEVEPATPPETSGTIDEIQLPTVDQLDGPAREKFVECMARYANDLWREVGQLEAAQRTTSGAPEITSTIVDVADGYVRGPFHPRRKSKRVIAASVIALASTLGCGGALDNLDSGWGVVAFVVTFTVAMISSLYAFVRA